jgi:hypothetical protein
MLPVTQGNLLFQLRQRNQRAHLLQISSPAVVLILKSCEGELTAWGWYLMAY